MFKFDIKDDGSWAKESLENVVKKMGAIYDFYFYRDQLKQEASPAANAAAFQFTKLDPKIISPSKLLESLVNQLKLSKQTVLLAFYYIDVLHKGRDYFRRREVFALDTSGLLNRYSIHCLLVASLHRAHQSLSEGVINTKYFSRLACLELPGLSPTWLATGSKELFQLLAADFIIPDASKVETHDRVFYPIFLTLNSDYEAFCLSKPTLVLAAKSSRTSAVSTRVVTVKLADAKATATVAAAQSSTKVRTQPIQTADPRVTPTASVGVVVAAQQSQGAVTAAEKVTHPSPASRHAAVPTTQALPPARQPQKGR